MTLREENKQEGGRTGFQFFKNLSIAAKLTIGFGILVALIFLSAGVSYLGSEQASVSIKRTNDLRVPTALGASLAQADLLRMQADVRGYLALGEQVYREGYKQSSQAFEADLAILEALSPNLDAINRFRLDELKVAYDDWSELPETLFELRDDQLDREPAYRLLVITGTQHAGQALIDINEMIETQGQREPTPENLERLQDMANFQGNFAAMLSGLRGYVSTRNRVYRGEYEVNLVLNDQAWERLVDNRDMLTANQQELLDEIAVNREAFLELPDEMFAALESDRWREDLYLFNEKAVPLTVKMDQLLNEMTTDQQVQLATELEAGLQDLATANNLILASGVVALIVGLLLTVAFRSLIAGPVLRLTGVADQIRAGALEAKARVESRDEIGKLAETFNNMTAKLRQTLNQVRKEKKRADDLLEVVIPIGVDLASEKDFNRLLEKMLHEAKTFCHADAGTLYLRTDDDRLKFVIVQNDSQQVFLGGTTGQEVPFASMPLYDAETGNPNHDYMAAHVTLTGVSTNVSYMGDPTSSHPYGEVSRSQVMEDYMVVTMLTIPLKNSLNQVLGVLQLLNAQDPETGMIVPFDDNLQQMMESFSSLAVAALEAYIREQSLRQEIQQLRIEIDEVKRQKQVGEIVESDFFQDIKSRARALRERRRSSGKEAGDQALTEA